MLLRRIPVPLAAQRLERVDQPRTRVARIDDVVDVAAGRGDVGMRELRAVLARSCASVASAGSPLSAISLLNRISTAPFGPHHRDLRRGPRDVEVAADVLGAHDVVRAAVRLARDDGELGHRRLAVGVQQLGAVPDDAAVLLRDAGQEAGHVLERDDRNVERVAEADEPRRLDATR